MLSSLPGFLMAALLFFTLSDPDRNNDGVADNRQTQQQSSEISKSEYFKLVIKSLCNPAMLLLLLAACVRHTAGYCWAYNTRLYFQVYFIFLLHLFTLCQGSTYVTNVSIVSDILPRL